MYMRDLVVLRQWDGVLSMPSDLVRSAFRATNADTVNGALAGGNVMSLLTRRDKGLVVAVTSNIAHADTAALAQESLTSSRNSNESSRNASAR